MPDIDPDRLIWIVTGVQLKAELGDRPLAYRVEQEIRDRLATLLEPPDAGEPPRLAPVVDRHIRLPALWHGRADRDGVCAPAADGV